MPNTKPMRRAMDWELARKRMPNSISQHLPKGDPLDNQDEIKRCINRMIEVGPEGKEVVEKYVDGEITEQQMEERLDIVLERTKSAKMETFRKNLRIIREETTHSVWKEIVPLMFTGPNKNRVIEAAERIEEVSDIQDTR